MAAALVARRLARRLPRAQPPTRAFVPDATQLLIDVQACTDLPWYATIPLTTLAVRSALVPASIIARRHGRRVNLAAPHLKQIQQLAAKRSQEKPDDKLGTAKLLTQGINGILKLHGARPSLLLLPFATTLPTLLWLALGVRGLPAEAPGFSDGGCLWFPDLVVTDAYLPCLCIVAVYANLERQLASPNKGASLAGVAKHVGQLAVIITAPITFGLPCGFHLFWLSSTAFTAASGEAFRRFDRMPPLPPTPPPVDALAAKPAPRRRGGGKKRRR